MVPAYEKLQGLRALLVRDATNPSNLANPTKIRKQLDEISTELRNLPAKVRRTRKAEDLEFSFLIGCVEILD